MNRPGRKRLAVDLPVELHEKIKKLARQRNITITTWIIRRCLEKIAVEDNYWFKQKG